MSKPKYEFGKVGPPMLDGTAVSVGLDESDCVTVEFDYKDNLTGRRYHVCCEGRRTEVQEDDVAEG